MIVFVFVLAVNSNSKIISKNHFIQQAVMINYEETLLQYWRKHYEAHTHHHHKAYPVFIEQEA